MEYYSWKKYLYFGRTIRQIALLFPKTSQKELFPAHEGEFYFAYPKQLVKVDLSDCCAEPYYYIII